MGSEVERLIDSFIKNITTESLRGKTIIELAVGFGTWGHFLRAQIDQGGDQAYIIGCDVYKPYLMKTRKYNPYDDLIICDVSYLPIRKDAADLIIACEVVEHLTKKAGEAFLKALPEAGKKVYVTMPCGNYPQGTIRGNQFENHRSTWTKQNLEKLGYATEITGLSKDFELYMPRQIYGIMQMLRKQLSIDRWGGTMLCAMYTKSEAHKKG